MAAENVSEFLSIGSEPGFDIVCIPCESESKHVEAEGYCVNCCEHLCAQCLKYHRTLSAVKHHKLVDKHNMPLNQTSGKLHDICTAVCSIHRDKVIEYYCPTHKVLGCNVCVTLKHKQCEDVAYIPEVSADLENSQEYKNFKQNLDQLMQKSVVMLTSAEEKLKTSVDLYSMVQTDICAFRHEINSSLDKLETEMKEKLEQINTQYTEELTAVSRKASRVIDELQTISTNFQELIDKKQNCMLFTEMKIKESSLVKLQETLEKVDNTDFQVCRFSANEEILPMLKAADALGKLVVRNTRTLRAAYVGDINFSTKRKTDQYCIITSMALVSKGKLVLTDIESDSVKLINLVNNKITSELKLNFIPSRVTALSEAMVAVSLPTASKILFLTCDDILRFDTEISVQGECLGIAYYQNKLIVTFDKPSKLEILSMTGEVLQRFENDAQGRQLVVEPMFVSVDTKEPAMFVSDWGNDSLTKVSMDGKVMAVYKDRGLSTPRQCFIDQAGLVYLCGESSNNIHLLTKDCTKLKIVLTSVSNPRTISYCEITQRLYVGLLYNDSIKVYQLNN